MSGASAMGAMRDFRRSNLVAYVLAPAARTLKHWCLVLSLHPILPKAATKFAGPVLQRSRQRLPTRYSIVVACYNVEKYIDDFFKSIFSQRVDLNCLEIIAVDDGSTDGPLRVSPIGNDAIQGRISYFRQSNQGQAVARNTGLAYATGDWVGFPDPDDSFSDQLLRPLGRGDRSYRIVANCRWCPAIWCSSRRPSESLRMRTPIPCATASERADDIAGIRSARSHPAFDGNSLVSPRFNRKTQTALRSAGRPHF